MRHGEGLICSHKDCQRRGIRFLYCYYCREPVAKANFSTRHKHEAEQAQQRRNLTTYGQGIASGAATLKAPPTLFSSTAAAAATPPNWSHMLSNNQAISALKMAGQANLFHPTVRNSSLNDGTSTTNTSVGSRVQSSQTTSTAAAAARYHASNTRATAATPPAQYNRNVGSNQGRFSELSIAHSMGTMASAAHRTTSHFSVAPFNESRSTPGATPNISSDSALTINRHIRPSAATGVGGYTSTASRLRDLFIASASAGGANKTAENVANAGSNRDPPGGFGSSTTFSTPSTDSPHQAAADQGQQPSQVDAYDDDTSDSYAECHGGDVEDAEKDGSSEADDGQDAVSPPSARRQALWLSLLAQRPSKTDRAGMTAWLQRVTELSDPDNATLSPPHSASSKDRKSG